MRRLLACGLTAALGAGATPALAAKPAVVTGRLVSGTARIPRSARSGRAAVLALDPSTAAYAAAARVGADGRYRLRLPAGTWALRSAVVTRSAARSFLSAVIRTRAGRARRLPKVALRKVRHRRRARRANVNPRDGRAYRGEAIAVRYFTGGTGEMEAFNHGMTDMLVSDLANATSCPMTIVDWERRGEVIREIELGQSPLFDPASRVEPGHLIDPELFVRGTISERATRPKSWVVAAHLENARTGARVSEDATAVFVQAGVFEAEQALVPDLVDLICARRQSARPKPKPVADRLSGSFGGTATGSGVTVTWSGTARLDAIQDAPVAPAGAAPGRYRVFGVASGSVDVRVSGSDGTCSLSGHASFQLGPAPLGGGQITAQVGVGGPWYTVTIGPAGTEAVDVARSGGPDCSGTSATPILAPFYAWTEARHATDTTLSGAATPSVGAFASVSEHWSFAPG